MGLRTTPPISSSLGPTSLPPSRGVWVAMSRHDEPPLFLLGLARSGPAESRPKEPRPFSQGFSPQGLGPTSISPSHFVRTQRASPLLVGFGPDEPHLSRRL
ncbi:hypothetical protein CRG98_041597 [Punica granatum]|uniref:Uncharacterized protein n=1 Tax=Punica granatum TaxID=22663 RepID=A0A2I0I213_PUNGR|nr:hypothetical protein CRG98_041597 [Punica granatum]